LADKIGLKKMLIFGIGIFSIVYGGMGFNQPLCFLSRLFALYGIYAAASEGISKHGSAIFQRYRDRYRQLFRFSKLFSMLASSLAGLIWYQFGADVTFIVTALLVF
jgi:hypothetical protein